MSTPLRSSNVAGPSRPRSLILDMLDGKMNIPATLPKAQKRVLDVRKEAPGSAVPAKRPWRFGEVKNEFEDDDDEDEDVVDLTIDDDPLPPRKKVKAEPVATAVKKEPFWAVVRDEEEDVIDLTSDEPSPAKEPKKLAPLFVKREERAAPKASTSAPVAQLPTPTPAPVNTPAAGGGLSTARLEQILVAILRDQKRVALELAEAKLRAKLDAVVSNKPPTRRVIEQKEREVKALKDQERKVRGEIAAAQAWQPRYNALREKALSQLGLPVGLAKKEEPDDEGMLDRLASRMPGPSRPASGAASPLPAGRAPALPQPPLYAPPAPRPPVVQPPGAFPAPYQPTTLPTTTQQPQNPFDYLAKTVGNSLSAGFNAVQNFAHAAAGYVPGGSIIGDVVDQFANAGTSAFGRNRQWDDEMLYDGYGVRDADALNKFIIAAGNADVFDASASVQEAMKGLGLENQQQLLPGMDCALLPHQLIAVKWMYDLETNKKLRRNGGILADEMGLGKTVQMIALMCKNPATKDGPKPTLIVAPVSLLEQWKAEIMDKTERHLKVHIYHSSNPYKAKRADWLAEHDVVITTFGILSKEFPKGMMVQQKPTPEDMEYLMARKAGLLYKVRWRRIVLDEAHTIRTPQTRVSQAVTHLDALYRWCLTGTPVINSLEDLYGYFRFIRLRPWNDWKEYAQHVVRIQKKQPNLAADRAQHILQTCLLRRQKNSMLDGRRLIELTNKEVVQIVLEFSREEREIYEYVQGKAQAVFNRYLRAGTVLKNYSHILVLILRLKQLCCHPALIQEQKDDPAIMSATEDEKQQKDELHRAIQLMGQPWVDQLKARLLTVMAERVKAEKRSLDEEVENDTCPVCYDTMASPMVTACMHTYCRVDKLFEKPMEPSPEFKADERPCPACRQPISQEKLFGRYAFEPSDKDLSNLIGEPFEEVKAELGVKYEEPIEIKDESDDDDMPTLNELMVFGLTPKARKGKAVVKKETKEKVRVKKEMKGKRRRSLSSNLDEKGMDSDDSMNDFIVQTDEDEDEKDRRKAKKKGKQRATVKAEPVSDDEPIVIDDSDEEDVKPVKPAKSKPSLKEMPRMSRFLPSTKMKRMMESIKLWADQYPTDKVMVISQFTSCLDLVARYLDENDVTYVRYQGNMKKFDRDQSVVDFQRKRGGPRVMLMSLKAGGVGLNLTRANRVIALDLAWSEAVENQAYDRVHRLGQTKDVLVERLIIQNSIEDELLKIQARKRDLADGSLGEGARGKIGRLSIREIAALFGIHDLRRR